MVFGRSPGWCVALDRSIDGAIEQNPFRPEISLMVLAALWEFPSVEERRRFATEILAKCGYEVEAEVQSPFPFRWPRLIAVQSAHRRGAE